MKKAIVNLCRMVLAIVFILSGFVKAIDPLGSRYKLDDYLEVMGLSNYVPDIATLALSIAQATVEFCLGILLLFAIQRRMTSRFILVIMAIMTPLTLWLALTDPISDCGCFGDAVVLTNWQTFGKNIILLAAAVVVARWPMEMFRFVSKSNQWIVTNYTMLFILVISFWCLYDRPIFDFRPYHIGANIKEGMEIPEGAEQPTFETTFILEKDGVQRSFGIDDYPDSTWTFVDSRTVQTKTGYVPPIHDFQITTLDGEDLTELILNDTSYVFLLIAPHIEDADDSRLDLINELYEYARAHNYSFYGLTASNEKAINRWRDITGAEYTFCQADETMLKTIIRSNPGLLLLKDATVIQKWSHNALPELDEASMAQPLGKLEIGQMPEDTVLHKIVRILLWFVLPLMLLTIADRTWAWSKWVRRKRLIRLWGNKGIKMPKDKNDDFLTNKSNKHMRKKIVAGNWKMNMNLQDGIALAKELNETLKADKPNCGVVICTPFIHLASIAQFLDQDIIGLGAENCADKEKGAFTGEVSA